MINNGRSRPFKTQEDCQETFAFHELEVKKGVSYESNA